MWGWKQPSVPVSTQISSSVQSHLAAGPVVVASSPSLDADAVASSEVVGSGASSSVESGGIDVASADAPSSLADAVLDVPPPSPSPSPGAGPHASAPNSHATSPRHPFMDRLQHISTRNASDAQSGQSSLGSAQPNAISKM
jgi:hypothetical protein